MKRHLLAAAAAALALCAPHAFATASASATLSNFTITLVDLDPNDGVAPSIMFTSFNGALTDAQVHQDNPSGDNNDFHNSTDEFGSNASSTSTPGTAAAASIWGDFYGGPGTLSASSASSAASAGDVTWAAAYAIVGDSTGGEAFLLSPDTRLVITATYSLSADTTNSYYYNAAEADATLLLEGNAASSFSALAGKPYDHPAHGATSGTISVSFDNLNDYSVGGDFQATVTAYAESHDPLVVPEPANATLMAMGLVAAGLASRRRRH